MAVWSYATIWELIAAEQPDRPAIVQGQTQLSWRDFDGEADAMASHLLASGLERNAKVGAYLQNSPHYLVATHAAFKAGLAPFNVNYRYGAEELFYLFDNADAAAVFFHTGYSGRIEEIRGRLPLVRSSSLVELCLQPASHDESRPWFRQRV